jgi:hypothetical protein
MRVFVPTAVFEVKVDRSSVTTDATLACSAPPYHTLHKAADDKNEYRYSISKPWRIMNTMMDVWTMFAEPCLVCVHVDLRVAGGHSNPHRMADT